MRWLVAFLSFLIIGCASSIGFADDSEELAELLNTRTLYRECVCGPTLIRVKNQVAAPCDGVQVCLPKLPGTKWRPAKLRIQ